MVGVTGVVAGGTGGGVVPGDADVGQVKIGREFFANAKKDYTSPNWAWVREIMQNSVDAPRCTTIRVFTGLDADGNTTVVVANDGLPMTEEILVGKLLTLGASGKRCGTDLDGKQLTGGFGKAKELLYFSQLRYSIITGSIHLKGEGGDYEITPTVDGDEPGTRSWVLMEGDVREQIGGALRRFCQFAQWPGEVYLNDERLETVLRKGTPRRDFTWCKVYSNRSFERVMVIRINGTPMFTRKIDFKGCLVVELQGRSDALLSANRDGLLWEFQSELDAFCTQLAVDKRSALREKRAEYKRYEGERLRHEAARPKAAASILELFGGGDEGSPQKLADFVRGGDREVSSGISTVRVSAEDVAVTIGPEFILKNTTGMVTPDYYTPGPLFSDYSKKLALAWARCLLELHRILEMPGDFSIGFCLDEDSGAEFERSSDYGTVYYINPARLVAQRDKPQCRSFRAAFTGAWADRFEIISLAIHELIHGRGFSSHDECYSSELTRVFGLVLPHIGKLTPLFRG